MNSEPRAVNTYSQGETGTSIIKAPATALMTNPAEMTNTSTSTIFFRPNVYANMRAEYTITVSVNGPLIAEDPRNAARKSTPAKMPAGKVPTVPEAIGRNFFVG